MLNLKRLLINLKINLFLVEKYVLSVNKLLINKKFNIFVDNVDNNNKLSIGYCVKINTLYI